MNVCRIGVKRSPSRCPGTGFEGGSTGDLFAFSSKKHLFTL